MGTIIIDRRDARLDADQATMLVEVADEGVTRVPLAQVERLVIRGRASISTRLFAALHRTGAGILILSGRRSEPSATLLGKPHADAAIRAGQLLLHLDPQSCLSLARWVVAHKIAAEVRTLARGEAMRADRRALLNARRTLPPLITRLRTTSDRAEVNGVEGAAAATYFAGLADIFPAAARFAGRNRRPPRDPGNALLSLGYTIALFEASREAAIAGLDPLVGFLHALSPGRPSLSCDLIEPLRPRVDAWAVGLFRDEKIRRDHFRRDGEAYLLGKAGRAIVLAAWEDEAATFRRLLRTMCRMLRGRARNAARALGGIETDDADALS